MAYLNATCEICGKKYHRCDTCDKYHDKFVSWKMYADCEDHFHVFTILRNLFLNYLSKSEAKQALQKLDLSDIDSWEDNENKKLVKELLSYNNRPTNNTNRQKYYKKK